MSGSPPLAAPIVAHSWVGRSMRPVLYVPVGSRHRLERDGTFRRPESRTPSPGDSNERLVEPEPVERLSGSSGAGLDETLAPADHDVGL
jgi:hypothetical protein